MNIIEDKWQIIWVSETYVHIENESRFSYTINYLFFILESSGYFSLVNWDICLSSICYNLYDIHHPYLIIFKLGKLFVENILS